MVPLNDGEKVVGLGFEIISKLDSYFLMTAVGTYEACSFTLFMSL